MPEETPEILKTNEYLFIPSGYGIYSGDFYSHYHRGICYIDINEKNEYICFFGDTGGGPYPLTKEIISNLLDHLDNPLSQAEFILRTLERKERSRLEDSAQSQPKLTGTGTGTGISVDDSLIN